jgi:hypothetical protein
MQANPLSPKLSSFHIAFPLATSVLKSVTWESRIGFLEQGLQGLHGLHGLQGFFFVHGLHGLHGFFSAASPGISPPTTTAETNNNAKTNRNVLMVHSFKSEDKEEPSYLRTSVNNKKNKNFPLKPRPPRPIHTNGIQGLKADIGLHEFIANDEDTTRLVAFRVGKSN